MRLKTFSAPNMSLAMARVRDVLGTDAVIISTRDATGNSDACITAAVEDAAPSGFDAFEEREDGRDPLDVIDDALDFHRVPPALSDPLRAAATNFSDAGPVAQLAGALDMQFQFQPLDVARTSGPIVLVGPPGGGKTIACAKIAAAALLAERPVRLVNTDTQRAGGSARLHALAERLSLIVEDAPDIATLETCTVHNPDEIIVIDTPGANPFDEEELAALGTSIRAARGMTCLVIAAGLDAYDAAEQASAFAAIGAQGLIAARLDTSLRYGGLLAAAKAGRLAFAATGFRPEIGDGLNALNPVSLARILISRSDDPSSPFEQMTQSS